MGFLIHGFSPPLSLSRRYCKTVFFCPGRTVKLHFAVRVDLHIVFSEPRQKPWSKIWPKIRVRRPGIKNPAVRKTQEKARRTYVSLFSLSYPACVDPRGEICGGSFEIGLCAVERISFLFVCLFFTLPALRRTPPAHLADWLNTFLVRQSSREVEAERLRGFARLPRLSIPSVHRTADGRMIFRFIL